MLNRFSVFILCWGISGPVEMFATRFGVRKVFGIVTIKREGDFADALDARGFPGKKGSIVEVFYPMQNRLCEEGSSSDESDDEGQESAIEREMMERSAISHARSVLKKEKQRLKQKKRSASDPVAPRAGAKKPRMTIEELPLAKPLQLAAGTKINIVGKGVPQKKIIRRYGRKKLGEAPQLGAARDDMPPLECASVPPLRLVQPPLAVLATVAPQAEERRSAVMAQAQASMSINYDSVD